VAGLPCWVGSLSSARAQGSESSAVAIRVTSDSRQYCMQLADTLEREEEAYPPGPDLEVVRSLGREGERMCREGHIRPGILRIREALLKLRHRSTTPEAH
jgi:hypothetical protein